VAATICFTCGEPVGEPYRLNRLEDGKICPTCCERVLQALPPIFPSREETAEPIVVDPENRDTDVPPKAS
jgi:hypothetical protein